MDVAAPPPWPPPTDERSVRRLLVVCTANVCRSPVAERLLQRGLDDATAGASTRWEVRSAGTAAIRATPDPRTSLAAATVGIELDRHVPRHLDRALLRTDGADLVVTMARAHLRHVIALDGAAWSRTFTLKELVRRALVVPPATASQPFDQWLAVVGADRSVSGLLGSDPVDDVADPYGCAPPAHVAMVDEVAGLVQQLARVGPWRHRSSLGTAGGAPEPEG